MRTKELMYFILLMCLIANVSELLAQGKQVDGDIMKLEVIDGDTILTYHYDEITVTSKRRFASPEEKLLYQRYRYYAKTVHPYALEAIRIFQSMERDTKHLSKRKKKKYIRNLHKELKTEFTDPLKDLSKTQGKILVHMIEKELDTPMYELIKGLKSGLTATYWQTLSSLFGYDLKEGYVRGKDPLMDMVLDDFKLNMD